MIVNNFELPSSFMVAISKKKFKRDTGSWELRKNEDAFGNKLETELGEIFDTVERIKMETEALPEGFEADGYYGDATPDLKGPGSIPDILDFSKIICFGMSGDGAPFCFDFRESLRIHL